MESRRCKLFAVKNDTKQLHAQWMKWVWEGEILPAAPAYCGNNERGVDLRGQVGADQGRVQVKVLVPGPIQGGRWLLLRCTGFPQIPETDGLGAGRPGRSVRQTQEGKAQSWKRMGSGWLAVLAGKKGGVVENQVDGKVVVAEGKRGRWD